MVKMIDWGQVAESLRRDAKDARLGWRYGQDAALRWLADTLPLKPGALIADEVGLGKTRIAVAVMQAVAAAGGKVAAVVPPTLMFQWEGECAALRKARGNERDHRDEALLAKRRQLRVFLDAFPEDADASTYPLNKKQPFLLLSHRFGLAGRIGGKVGDYAWALPYIVRSFIDHGLDNWRGAKGLNRQDRRFDRQLAAARWLAKKAKSLRPDMDSLPPLNDNTGSQFAIRIANDAPAQLLRRLLGRLLGGFDLVVIDEAHKSRETEEEETRSRRRLPLILDEIIQPSDGGKRLGLTATPIQMSVEDWTSTLKRIGIAGADLEGRQKKIVHFESERIRLRSGPASEEDVKALCGASNAFRSALADVMIRRRWSNHPDIREARKVFGSSGAHPHRRWDGPAAAVSWQCLSPSWKRALLAAEGASLAAVGSSLALVERHRAFRQAQAMDGASEATIDIADGTTDAVSTSASEEGQNRPKGVHGTQCVQNHCASGQEQRVAYWKRVGSLAMLDDQAAGNKIELMRHPRLLAAMSWIERVTERGGKVLVFATYKRPLHALTDALNLRRYLRDLAEERPTMRPRALRGMDAQAENLHLKLILETMPDSNRLGALGDLTKRAEACQRHYKNRLTGLLNRLPELLPPLGSEELRSFLRIVLLEPWLDNIDGAALHDMAGRVARALDLGDRKDEDDAPDPAIALREALKLELEQMGINAEGSTFPRSDFARTLDGGSDPATRRVVQALFNEASCRPRVLVAQSRVASEGLNLHAACRHVLFLHLEWNPALIEQQIGRVDRIESLWSKEFAASQPGTEPRIELAAVVLEGTSDAEKRDRIVGRQKLLAAHIFGEVLPADVMNSIRPEWRNSILDAVPDFSP